MKKILVIFFIITMLNNCDYFDPRLKIRNRTDYKISIIIVGDTIIKNGEFNKKEYYIGQQLIVDSIKHFSTPGKMGWSIMIKNSINKKLNVFVYNVDTILKYERWDSLTVNTKYIRKLSYSEDELNKMNWLITIK